jgi:hypothetical protein
VDSILSTFNISAPEIEQNAGLPAIVGVPVVDFVLPVATSLLFLTFLLLLPSLLLVVARIFPDFEFTILAGVLTFYKTYRTTAI